MSKTAKGVAAIVIIGGLLAATVSLASAKSDKPSPRKDDELDLEDDEVSVSIPTGGGSADVILNSDEVEATEDLTEGQPAEIDDSAIQAVIDATKDGEKTSVDEDLEVLAAEEGVTEKSAIKDVLTTITGGAPSLPLSGAETSREMDPHGTVKLARILLSRETMPDWKNDLKSDVEEWQTGLKSKGFDITPDGQFGPKSAAFMATEVGIMPLVRFWPKDVATKKQAKARYSMLVGASLADLNDDLPDSQAQIDALKMSMAREQAQSFDKNPGPQPVLEFVQKVNDRIGAKAQAATEKELAS